MAIADILQALEEQAMADIEAVLTEAREHASLITKQGEAEAAGIHDGFVKQVERNATSRASKIVNAARLEAKMAVSSARGDGLEQVFAQARQALSNVRQGGSYDRLFAALAAQAMDGMGGQVVIRIDPADEQRARTAAAAAGVDASVVADLSSAGGLIVEGNNGRIVRRNTLEDRLERSRQSVQTEVAKALFA